MRKVPGVSMIDPRGQGGKGSPGGNVWCALCGSEYVAGVAECVDCLVPLVDQPPLAVDDIGDDDGEQVAYEYDDVDAAERLRIDRLLADRGIVHAWDGTTLVVARYDEVEVDELLDKIDAPHDIDDALLDEDAEQLVYDIGDWDAERRAELDGLLEAAGLPHAFDEDGDLVVLAADEEQVDAIIDQVEFPDQLDPTTDEPGGLDAVETLGNLFVAADRLVHDPVRLRRRARRRRRQPGHGEDGGAVRVRPAGLGGAARPGRRAPPPPRGRHRARRRPRRHRNRHTTARRPQELRLSDAAPCASSLAVPAEERSEAAASVGSRSSRANDSFGWCRLDSANPSS